MGFFRGVKGALVIEICKMILELIIIHTILIFSIHAIPVMATEM
jgi:hypothetical protein